MWILSELNHIMYCDSVSFLVIHLCFSWADHWHLFWLLSFLCAYHWFTAKISKSITILFSKLSIHQIIFKSLLFFFFFGGTAHDPFVVLAPPDWFFLGLQNSCYPGTSRHCDPRNPLFVWFVLCFHARGFFQMGLKSCSVMRCWLKLCLPERRMDNLSGGWRCLVEGGSSVGICMSFFPGLISVPKQTARVLPVGSVLVSQGEGSAGEVFTSEDVSPLLSEKLILS